MGGEMKIELTDTEAQFLLHIALELEGSETPEDRATVLSLRKKVAAAMSPTHESTSEKSEKADPS